MYKTLTLAILISLCACVSSPQTAKDDSPGHAAMFSPEDLQDAPVIGDPDAPVTIVEFSDFQCFFCWLSEATLKRVLEDYKGKVNLLWIHIPLKMHPNAYIMAAASILAQRQGRFWQFHDVVYQSQAEWGSLKGDELADKLILLAEIAGLDMPRFKDDLENEELYRAILEKDMALAKRVGVRGTPTFYIDGQKISGAQPYEKFAAAIEAALDRR